MWRLAPLERAIADDSGAEERRRLCVAELGWNRVRKRFGHDRVLRVASVRVVTGEALGFAEVLARRPAVLAGAVRVTEPCDADPVAVLEPRGPRSEAVHGPDDLMPGDDRELVRREVPFDHVKVGSADAAREDADTDFTRTGVGIGYVAQAER
jgi:hypothetical protein